MLLSVKTAAHRHSNRAHAPFPIPHSPLADGGDSTAIYVLCKFG